MVTVFFSERFAEVLSHIKDGLTKTQVQRQIAKIRHNPKVGKPMSHERKGTRELRVKPYRLSYAYLPSEDRVVLLDLYHKKKQ